MSKLDELQKAIDLLKDQDIDALKQALALLGEPLPEATIPVTGDYPFEIGRNYFIRTVTYFQVGRLTAISGGFLVLEDASWVADTGRFMQALQTGKFSEVEPSGKTIVNLSSIVDAFPFEADLPKEQK